MSKQPIQLGQAEPTMDIEATTYHCSHCNQEILTSNQLTHDAVCARLHCESAQRSQPIPSQQSSSTAQQQQQRAPIMRRDDRRSVQEPKMITCPNCQQKVQESSFMEHQNYDCSKADMIPCEFCDQTIPLNNYNQHIESCPNRPQNLQETQTHPNPIMIGRENLQPGAIEEESPNNQSDSSPIILDNQRQAEQGSSQGRFTGFLMGLANSAANHLRNLGNVGDNQGTRSQQQQQQQQAQRQQTRPEPRLEQFPSGFSFQPSNRGGMMLLGNPFMQNQNDMMSFQVADQPQGRVMRTIQQRPDGSVVVRTRVVQDPHMQMMQGQPDGGMGMGGLGMLLSMMNGGFPPGMHGMQVINLEDLENQLQQENGLDKETMDSLAVVKYNKKADKNVDPEAKNCPICLDAFEDGQDLRFLWCMHRFHKNCVDKWLEAHRNCPICKKDFSEAQQHYN